MDKNGSHRDAIHDMARQCGYGELTPLQQKVIPTILAGRDLVVKTKDSRGKSGAVMMPLLRMLRGRRRGVQAVILAPAEKGVAKMYREYRRFRSHTRLLAATVSEEKDFAKEIRQLAGRPDIVVGTPRRVIDHLRQDNLALDGTQALIIMENGDDSGFRRDVQYIATKLPPGRQTVVFSPHFSRGEAVGVYPLKSPVFLDTSDLVDQAPHTPTGQTEETEIVSTKKETSLPNQETAKRAIADILKIVKEQANPEELNGYRALVKSNVPIFMRSYFAAYLFKKSLDSFADRPSELTKLFVSVGKNRRVFPKDLTKLFISRLGIQPSDIGDVKVLDNYSFIDINLDHAQRAISEMSGTNFRGRRITVNLARKKDDDAE